MKTCSYSCIYCQLGRTIRTSILRRRYCEPEEVARVVERALENVDRVDYLTFVGDGEPTLYSLLGKAATLVSREFGYRVALISNASLVWRRDVREDSTVFDFVSMKLDAATPSVFRRVNRPDNAIRISAIISGLEELSKEISGILSIETVLVDGVNDGSWHADLLAEALRKVEPYVVYINAPIRPPAEKWVRVPRVDRLRIFAERLSMYLGKHRVILLPLAEIDEVLARASTIESLLEIAKLHPVPLDLALSLLKREHGDKAMEVLRRYLERGSLTIVKYRGREYIRARQQT